MLKRLWKSKTAWAVVTGVVTAVGAAATGEMEWVEAFKVCAPLIVGLFIRDGIAKIGN